MRIIDGEQAGLNRRANAHATWHAGASGDPPRGPDEASARIFGEGVAVQVRYPGRRLKKDEPVFTMGSCFAREVEFRLVKLGGAVSSVDDSVRGPEFTDAEGRVRTGFFHRFTPASMLQEFRRAFDDLPGWKEDSLLFGPRRGLFRKTEDVAYDLHYSAPKGLDYSLQASLARRSLAKALVRKAAEARLVILTLGLIEGWRHRPTGLHVNGMDPRVLARAPGDFEVRIADAGEVQADLEAIYQLLKRARGGEDFDLAVSVSPVPMKATFTQDDVIVANMESKATLRAAAGAFTARRANTHYFPAYEMAVYSDPAFAWRPDRLHVNAAMVTRIVTRFMDAYYEPLGGDA